LIHGRKEQRQCEKEAWDAEPSVPTEAKSHGRLTSRSSEQEAGRVTGDGPGQAAKKGSLGRTYCITGGAISIRLYRGRSTGHRRKRVSRLERHQSPNSPVVSCELIWLPPRDSNPDMLIQSSVAASENKGVQQLSLAQRGKVRKDPQPRRNQKAGPA